MNITGHTLIYALIGDPISHVRTPQLYNQKFADRGLDVKVVPVHVSPRGLEDFARMARSWHNLVGIGVTIPHKEALTALVDDLSEPARLCGATNVIRRHPDGRLEGTQMDGPGFVLSLVDAGFDPAGRMALLVGAGGTAKAIAHELVARGVSELTITNRTADRAEALASGVRLAFPGCTVHVAEQPEGQFDLVVNATSVGMRDDDPLPVDPQVLRPGTHVADVIMSPPETALLSLAKERGCSIHPGLNMLESQFEATVRFLGLDDVGGARS